MKQIPLHKGVVGRQWASRQSVIGSVLVDDEDEELLSSYRWFAAGQYAVAFITGIGRVKLHHLLTGRPLKGFTTSHHNGNGLDNRRFNLSIESHSMNKVNPYDGAYRTKMVCPYRGVFFKGPMRRRTGEWWFGRLQYRGKRYFTSYTRTPEEARDLLEVLRERKGVVPDVPAAPVDVAIRRWEAYSGQAAVLLRGESATVGLP